MKHLVLIAATVGISLAACNNNKPAGNTDSTQTVAGTPAAAAVSPVKEIVSGYLQIKNALAADNASDAAAAGKTLAAAFGSIDASTIPAEHKTLYTEIEGNAKEHAEHIGDNAGNIKHQREHFEMLSKDVYDLVKAMGAGQPLYYDFCPMYNDNKGGSWLSETQEIKNPYFGSSMLTCGSVKEELK